LPPQAISDVVEASSYENRNIFPPYFPEATLRRHCFAAGYTRRCARLNGAVSPNSRIGFGVIGCGNRREGNYAKFPFV